MPNKNTDYIECGNALFYILKHTLFGNKQAKILLSHCEWECRVTLSLQYKA